MKHEITRDDLLSMEDYESRRDVLRKELLPRKRNRRVAVGPECMFYFENYDTMWAQVHEMLFIERGGDEQIEDELSAYNPLIPKGRELVATVMFEIDDRDRRSVFLSKLGGIEETAFVKVDGETIRGVPETDVDRSTADGKASAVQFIHFPFSDAQVEAFRRSGAEVVLGFEHERYGHMVRMPEEVREELTGDFS